MDGLAGVLSVDQTLIEILYDFTLFARPTFHTPDARVFCAGLEKMLRDDSAGPVCSARLPTVPLLESGGCLLDVHLKRALTLLVQLAMLAVIPVRSRGQFLQIVGMHFIRRHVVVFFGLFLFIFVDFGFDINELVSSVSSPTLAVWLPLNVVVFIFLLFLLFIFVIIISSCWPTTFLVVAFITLLIFILVAIDVDASYAGRGCLIVFLLDFTFIFWRSRAAL